MNDVTLIGRLTKDVELRYLQDSGTGVASFILAVDRDFKNKNGERETDFIPIQVMGKMAENMAKYLSKGSLVAINGNLRIDKYTDNEGTKRSFTKVSARNVQFLDTKKGNNKDDEFVPNFEPGGFQQVEDDDIPF